MEILLILVAVVVVTGLVILIGRALGDPHQKQSSGKFDETPADVAALDVSDGAPLDFDIPRQMSPEEQEQATKQFERLRVQIEAER